MRYSFYLLLWCFFNFKAMPSKEYRILINGKIVMRNWTSRQHTVWTDVYLDRGVEFTEEIVDLH